jgi:mRNA deadenylase 3'-5' endonuclease subunit Ccr4
MAKVERGQDAFSVVSYNVLATAYIHPAWYRRTPAMVLQPAWRVPALAQRVANLAAGVICLQEVELETLGALRTRLAALGYAAEYARRKGAQPDGCATFYRKEIFACGGARTIAYDDGDGDIALIVALEIGDRSIAVANTHLAWEPPETPSEGRRGPRKIRRLLAEREADARAAWVICGDLNATPESEVVAALQRAGFQYAHSGFIGAYTCNTNGEAKTIDYLFHSPNLWAEPEPVPRLTDAAALPSPAEPSDHLPVVSRFHFKS